MGENRARDGIRRVYGLNVRSAFDFDTALPPGEGDPDLTFRCVEGPTPPLADVSDEPAFASPVRLNSGAPFMAVHSGRRMDLVRFSEVADFLVSDDQITCYLLDTAYAHMVEIHLLGAVFAYWFERRGVPMLHASAVVVDGAAVVFVATNKGGKSSLAATALQAGFPLLTDDVLGIDEEGEVILGRPGYPSMRFWPDLAEHFVGGSEELPLAHPSFAKRRLGVGAGSFGSFHDEPVPLGGFYLPERRPPSHAPRDIQIQPLPVSRTVIELVRTSFLPRTVDAMGFARTRLPLLGKVAARVPAKRLIYPDGLEHLPRVREAILEDLAEARVPVGGGHP